MTKVPLGRRVLARLVSKFFSFPLVRQHRCAVGTLIYVNRPVSWLAQRVSAWVGFVGGRPTA